MQLEPRKELIGLTKTVHGGQAWKLDGIEDYSQNLNPLGPPKDLDGIVASAIANTGHYPDADCSRIKGKIAEYYKLKPENIAIGCGSSEIIRNFPFAFVNPGESVLIPSPSFAEYTQQCKLAGAQIDYLPLMPENDFRIDKKELFAKLSEKHYKALYICNPNNPTGRIEPRDKLLEIVRFCEEKGTMVFLDETLLELCSECNRVSLREYVGQFTNLLVANSFTKSFAVPGIRIGFALSNPEIISYMEEVKLPWNVGTIEQTVIYHLVDFYMSYAESTALDLKTESEMLHSRLEDVGLQLGAVSDSFFYFMSVEYLGITAKDFVDRMLKEGFMVRDCSSFGPRFTNYIRFCSKDRERNERFVTAVEHVLASLGH